MPLDLPPAFLDRMGAQLGAELPDFLRALESPADGLRVNTLRTAGQRFVAMSPFRLRPVLGVPEGFVIEDGDEAGKHPYHAAGLYYLQDPGAMVAGAVVDPRPGERVLDLSAAPGGKATHLAARMAGEGVLVANDPHRGRARELLGNIERLGVTNAVVTAETPERLARRFGAYFDRVLVDAPCSGEAMFHKSRAARADWSEAAVAGCARRQEEILGYAASMVVEGGLLVYSTCTFSPEENEEVVGRLLGEREDFEIAAVPPLDGGDSVRIGDSSAGIRLWPHRFPGAGHTIVAMRRRAGGERVSAEGGRSPNPPSVQALEPFMSSVFPATRLPMDRLRERGGELYLAPPIEPDLGGLYVVRSGVHLGAERRHGFEPAHALALAFAPAAEGRRVDLTAEDPSLAAYLRGETVRAEGESGWVVVTVDGFALGWGKRTGNVVKNHYPKGLRRHR